MNKSTKIILNIDEEEISFYKKQYLNAVDIYTQIEELFANKPDGRKKKETKEWKQKINFLIDLYNAKSGFKSYTKIK